MAPIRFDHFLKPLNSMHARFFDHFLGQITQGCLTTPWILKTTVKKIIKKLGCGQLRYLPILNVLNRGFFVQQCNLLLSADYQISHIRGQNKPKMSKIHWGGSPSTRHFKNIVLKETPCKTRKQV